MLRASLYIHRWIRQNDVMIPILLTVVLEISLYSFRDAAAQVLMEYLNVGSIGANTILGTFGMFFAVPAIYFMSKHFGRSKSTPSVADIPKTDEVQTQPSTDRVYTTWAVDEIWESMKGSTSIQIAHLAQLHIGKWLKVSNKVRNVDELSTDISVSVKASSIGLIFLLFPKNRWKGRLETVRKGDGIIAEGKITKIDEDLIRLEDCEVIEIKPKESSSSKEPFDNIDPNKCDE